mgnify:CR=1 FL=1
MVHPELNLSTLDAGILIMVQKVSLMFGWTSIGDQSKMFLLIEFCCWNPLSCLKVRGGGMVGGGGLQHFSVSPGPLGFGFGAKGLGPGLDNNFFFNKNSSYLADITESQI